jgi:hypothetical protein
VPFSKPTGGDLVELTVAAGVGAAQDAKIKIKAASENVFSALFSLMNLQKDYSAADKRRR